MGNAAIHGLRFGVMSAILGVLCLTSSSTAHAEDPALPALRSWAASGPSVNRNVYTDLAQARIDELLQSVPAKAQPAGRLSSDASDHGRAIVGAGWTKAGFTNMRGLVSGEWAEQAVARHLMLTTPTWIGAQPSLDIKGSSIESELRIIQPGRTVRINAEKSRLMMEQGTTGAGNGVIDPGEWVYVNLHLERSISQPLYSSSAWVRSADPCVWTWEGDETVLAEMYDGEQGVDFGFWAYISKDCQSGRAAQLMIETRDSWVNDGKPDVVNFGLVVGRPPVLTDIQPYLDRDMPGSSTVDAPIRLNPTPTDGTGTARYELRVDAQIPGARRTSMKYVLPNVKGGLIFDAISYADRDMVKGNEGRFIASDDLDFTMGSQGQYKAWVMAMDRPWAQAQDGHVLIGGDFVVHTRPPDILEPECDARFARRADPDTPAFDLVGVDALIATARKHALVEARTTTVTQRESVVHIAGDEVLIEREPFCMAVLDQAGVPRTFGRPAAEGRYHVRGYFTLPITPIRVAPPPPPPPPPPKAAPTGPCCVDQSTRKILTYAGCNAQAGRFYTNYRSWSDPGLQNACKEKDLHTFTAHYGWGFSGLVEFESDSDFDTDDVATAVGSEVDTSELGDLGEATEESSIISHNVVRITTGKKVKAITEVSWRTSDYWLAIVHALGGARLNLVYEPMVEVGPYVLVGSNMMSVSSVNESAFMTRAGMSVDVYPTPVAGLWMDLGFMGPSLQAGRDYRYAREKPLWFALGADIGF